MDGLKRYIKLEKINNTRKVQRTFYKTYEKI